MEVKHTPFFVVVGPSGSGKTTLVRQSGLQELVSWTTREPRAGEVEGIDYHYVDARKFQLEPMVERVEFDSYAYGTPTKSFDTADIIVAEPNGAVQLWKHCLSVGRECRIIGITCSEAVRRERMLKRGDSKEKVESRQKNDEQAFTGFESICDVVISGEVDGSVEFNAYLKQEIARYMIRAARADMR